ncbi:hypothetical protein [Rheinheimera sp.]|uniref:hypothetical protein n=1 Tax=Rheinheimera sp. TaxID=1869214 RepID=UPI002FDDEA82
MKLNTHQQQLLQILRIKPLNLHADFLSFSVQSAVEAQNNLVNQRQAVEALALSSDADTGFATSAETTAETAPQSSANIEWPLLQLQQDIQLSLKQKSVQLSAEVGWQTSPELNACYLDGMVLHTPALSDLTTAETKRQLWQLLNDGWSDV